MKVVKAKYYQETNEVVTLDPQPKRSTDGTWDYERTGKDEKGDLVVIDFITEESQYFEYIANDSSTTLSFKETTEEEWNKTETLDIESMDLILQSNVQDAAVSISPELPVINTKTSHQTFLMATGKLIRTIVQPFFSVYNAIIKNFRY
jgi:hypothetical protein